jgi:hypothetical protein
MEPDFLRSVRQPGDFARWQQLPMGIIASSGQRLNHQWKFPLQNALHAVATFDAACI